MKISTASILILIAIGLFYTFTNPMYQSTKSLSAQVDEYKNVLKNVSRIEETRDALVLEYQEVPKAEIERLLKVLPDDIDNVRLALDLDSIAANYGIAIGKISVGTEGEEGAILAVSDNLPYQKVRVSFGFVSNYANFKRFLSDMESSLRVIDIREISFDSTDSGLYEFTVSIDTYWLK